jgi:hypothetical protein
MKNGDDAAHETVLRKVLCLLELPSRASGKESVRAWSSSLAAQVQNMGLAVSQPMARRDGWLGEKVGEEGGTPLQTCTAILSGQRKKQLNGQPGKDELGA